jgi:hypothetical protein
MGARGIPGTNSKSGFLGRGDASGVMQLNELPITFYLSGNGSVGNGVTVSFEAADRSVHWI